MNEATRMLPTSTGPIAEQASASNIAMRTATMRLIDLFIK
jgi:hypothetical protein